MQTSQARPPAEILKSGDSSQAAGPDSVGLPLRLVLRSLVGLSLALAGTQSLAQANLPSLPNTATGTLTLNLAANAYYDNQYFSQTINGAFSLTHDLSAETITSHPAGAYGSQHRAWARGEVSPTAVGVYSRAYAYAQNSGPPYAASYSSFATASAQAYTQTPFLIQGGAPAGTQGTLQATLFVSGSVTVGSGPGSAFYDPNTFTGANGKASMYFWATGLNATGCTYYVDAGCLDIRRDYSGDTVNSNNAVRAWTLNIPFTFGDLSSFSLQMWTFADTAVTAGLNGGWIQYFAESDFENTLRWGGIQGVLDAQGQPVTGWGISSLPGVDLTVAAVPEPGTWAMMLLGIGALAARRCRPAG